MALATGKRNPLRALNDYGQSVWLDYIRRCLIASGELQRLVDEDGVRGVTSNPAIFEKAIAGSTDYTAAHAGLDRREDQDAQAIYEGLAIRDIKDTDDVVPPAEHASTAR